MAALSRRGRHCMAFMAVAKEARCRPGRNRSQKASGRGLDEIRMTHPARPQPPRGFRPADPHNR